MTGEEENKKAGKGFAGLSSLVSEVDTSLPLPVTQETRRTSGTSTAKPTTAAPRTQAETQQPQQRIYQETPQPPSDSPIVKWGLAICAVLVMFLLISQTNKQPISRAAAYSSPEQTTTPSYSTVPTQPPAPQRPEESMPAAGENIALSITQIKYCLAEDIRLEGAKTAINNYIDSDVNRFNAMVADYNSRCGSFRYRRGTLESARQDVELYRSQLLADGSRRFASNSSNGAHSVPAPDETVKVIQQKLNELGYKAGNPDGLMGRGTHAAIAAFQQDRGMEATGLVDLELLQELKIFTGEQ